MHTAGMAAAADSEASPPPRRLRGGGGAAAAEARECAARWEEAQRSPSIIGFNVHRALGDTLIISLDGTAIPACDVRLWEGVPGLGSDELVFLELLFAGAPHTWDDQRVGEACVTCIREYLQEHRVSEFRARLAERREQGKLRQRRGGTAVTGTIAEEGGDEKEDSWREFLGKEREAEPKVCIHAVVDVGGRGRRVLACRTSMAPECAWEVGELAYPRLFKEQTDREIEQEDRFFTCCYYGAICFIVALLLLWLCFFATGISRRSSPVKPREDL